MGIGDYPNYLKPGERHYPDGQQETETVDHKTHHSYITLQARVADWATRNFGVNPLWRMVAGITEEVGEFHDAATRHDAMDAIGDIAIYQMNLCADRGWQYGDFWQRACITVPTPRRNITAYLGEMCRAVLKRDQGIRGYDRTEVFESAVRVGMEGVTWHTVAWWQACGQDPRGNLLSNHLKYLVEVVDKVCSRDWVANPLDANLHEGDRCSCGELSYVDQPCPACVKAGRQACAVHGTYRTGACPVCVPDHQGSV